MIRNSEAQSSRISYGGFICCMYLIRLNLAVCWIGCIIALIISSCANEGQNVYDEYGRGGFDAIKQLVDKRPYLANSSNKKGVSILIVAINENDLESVNYLLEKGANPNVELDGVSALALAYYEKPPELPKLLIAYGANVNGQSGAKSTSPIFAAVMFSDKDSIEYLLEHGAELNVTGVMGQTPLHSAIVRGQPTIVETLLKAGADCTIKDANGLNSLEYAKLMHEAKQSNATKEIVHLIEKYVSN